MSLVEQVPFGVVVDLETIARLPSVDRLALLTEKRLVILRCLPGGLSRDDLVKYCSLFGTVDDAGGGAIFDIRERSDADAPFLFTCGPVPLHFDGALGSSRPDIVALYCRAAPEAASGGEGLYVDTTGVWNHANAERRAQWESVTLEYRVQDDVRMIPLVARHPRTAEPTLRLVAGETSEGWVNTTLETAVAGFDEPRSTLFQRELLAHLSIEAFCHVHEWRTGDLVVFDNHAVLHGRRPFRAGARRHLQRVHLHFAPCP